MASNDIGDWYRGIPRITKYWFTGSVVVPIAARFGLLNAHWLILVFELVVYRFQVSSRLSAAFCVTVLFPLGNENFLT